MRISIGLFIIMLIKLFVGSDLFGATVSKVSDIEYLISFKVDGIVDKESFERDNCIYNCEDNEFDFDQILKLVPRELEQFNRALSISCLDERGRVVSFRSDFGYFNSKNMTYDFSIPKINRQRELRVCGITGFYLVDEKGEYLLKVLCNSRSFNFVMWDGAPYVSVEKLDDSKKFLQFITREIDYLNIKNGDELMKSNCSHSLRWL